jgi:hypothetical protein
MSFRDAQYSSDGQLMHAIAAVPTRQAKRGQGCQTGVPDSTHRSSSSNLTVMLDTCNIARRLSHHWMPVEEFTGIVVTFRARGLESHPTERNTNPVAD